ncbi:DsrE family protein [Pseudoalteromonas sp.]|uniref:DsrE family protein n=1 Tax=Pseudoalteromonas sp. TaxID=53249 RepID=UPI003561F3C3
MASIIISYHANVTSHDSLQHLIRLINSAITLGHTIKGVFLYQDAVFHASEHFSLPSDELQIMDVWHSIAKLGIKLSLCVTAAEKRGLAISNTHPFEVAGLAEFAMDVAQTDKWVQIK